MVVFREPEKETTVTEMLIDKGYHISFAESCTAGKAAARLVNVPSASKVFDAGFITYSNDAKIKYLGVDEKSIEKFGVVSEEVAEEMARGAAKNTNSEVAVGITGIAGPTGGTEKKPVGTVCFGFYLCGVVKTYTKHFGAVGRNKVRELSVNFVYDILVKMLEGEISNEQI